jgi:formylglycine-generating enzyme required for sulfatase activity
MAAILLAACSVGAEEPAGDMIRLEPATFLMGSPADEPGRDDDETQHEVTLTRAFLLGRVEVTQSLWQEVMGVNPAKIKGEQNPVEMVNWFDCVEFCNRLSEREGLSPAYTITPDTVVWDREADGYRLPTEAEWEYACRAGSTTPHFGDLEEMAIFALNSGRKTRPVGGREPNAWGFHDMHGNVWEWTWNRWDGDYDTGESIDPVGPEGAGLYRVKRGGSWHRNPRDLRSASRATDPPTSRRNALGLRLARWAPTS